MVTDLEFTVLEKFFDGIGVEPPHRNSINFISRDRSPVGFYTDIFIDQGNIASSVSEGTYDKIPNARTKNGGAVLGFLIFVSSAKIFTIEGFVYGEFWPDDEFPVEFLAEDQFPARL